ARGPRAAGAGVSPPGAGRDAPLLRRDVHSGGRRDPGDFGHHGRDPLALRTGLVARPASRVATMSPERGERLYAVFEAALERVPAGRAALLDELCAGDGELRAVVERLLSQDGEAERDRFMESPASTGGAPRLDGTDDDGSALGGAIRSEGTGEEAPAPT